MDKVKFNIGGVIIEMDKEEASKAFEAGTVELKSDELVTYSKESFDTFKKNLGDEEYKKGRKDGVEIAVKDARNKLELDFEGKTVDNLLDAYKTKVESESNIKPTEKIKTLESDIEKLRNNYNTLQQDHETYKSNIEAERTQVKKDNTLLSFMPDNILVDTDIALMALKSKKGIDVTFSESGKPLQSINGEIQKDDTLEPKELSKDFISNNLKELGLLKVKEGGAGGGDNTGGATPGSFEDFDKRMEANGISQGSQEYNEKLNAEIKAGTVKM